MTRMSSPQGTDAVSRPVRLRGWVQTERAAHEAWSRLVLKKPTAAALLHQLVAHMGTKNAVVISQKVLASLMGVHERTVQRAADDLVKERWIQVIRLGRGKECAYVVNSRVAWGESRDKLTLAVFDAAVVADFDDQESALLGSAELRKIPVIFPGEMQLPTGQGEPPPSQPFLPNSEPDLPSIQSELEHRGQMRLKIDPETGEIL